MSATVLKDPTIKSLEKILRDTHKAPDMFFERYGPVTSANFVKLFEGDLCGGMELPIGEAVDAFDIISVACRKYSDYRAGFLGMTPSDRTGWDTRSKKELSELVSQIISVAERFEDFNDRMSFIRGMGNIAKELYSMNDWFFSSGPENIPPDLTEFFGQIKTIVRYMVDHDGDLDAVELVRDVLPAIVRISVKMDTVWKHLEIIKQDNTIPS